MTARKDNEQAIVRQLIAEHSYGGWEKAWKDRVIPWDAGEIQPPLRHLLESGEVDLPKNKGRALVPGCGKGYDALYLASRLGLDCLGIDISRTAIEMANLLLEDVPHLPMGKVTFEVRDFFELAVTDEEKFDVVYDYTFFVAIPPNTRPAWGSQMCKLVKPGGYLITLVFPIDEPKLEGPPFMVRPDHYYGPLGPGWEVVLDKEPDYSSPSHKDRERMVVWKKSDKQLAGMEAETKTETS